MDDHLGQIVDINVAGSERSGEKAERVQARALGLISAVLVIAIIVGFGLAYLLSRGLVRQLGGEPGYAAEVARQVASGNLALAVRLKANDKSSMLYAMSRMRETLADIVGGIKVSSDSVAAASGQIAEGNSQLSQRTEEQASALEETASSMEELTVTVKQNADNARHAKAQAHDTAEAAARGGEVVGKVVMTMQDIENSANHIVDIIAVIEGIAFQTNILALNAAVEAARAGEQGRGFAVVAGEVRSLAQRSATAAKEVRELIERSVGQVTVGSELVGQAGRTMQEIVTAVRGLADIIGDISTASVEQAGGIEQVNAAMTQIDEVTQQNAALVEEAAAAAASLDEQSHRLRDAVAVFKLGNGGASNVSTITRNSALVSATSFA
jgi:methyl-accepting chemotaxis protein